MKSHDSLAGEGNRLVAEGSLAAEEDNLLAAEEDNLLAAEEDILLAAAAGSHLAAWACLAEEGSLLALVVAAVDNLLAAAAGELQRNKVRFKFKPTKGNALRYPWFGCCW